MEVSMEKIKEYYDEATFRKLQGFIYQNKRVQYAWTTLKSILNYIKPKRILEIGCGIGDVAWRLASELPEARVVGFDISGRSIDMASQLFMLPNLSFVQNDYIADVKFSDADKFDIIFLMDVYEHIPACDKPALHKFISQNIAKNGFLFLSCPTPQHLHYLKINNPSEIQPVDEDITLTLLMSLAEETLLRMVLYKEVSVWHAGDYFHAIFSNELDMKLFSDFDLGLTPKSVGLKKEIVNRLKRMVSNRKDDKTNEIMKRKALIEERLGSEILERVEMA